VVTRRYTPGWAVTLGILGLIFFLLGLLFFLVKKTETLTISISPRGETSSTVVISGEAETWVIESVQAALTSHAIRECPACRDAMQRREHVPALRWSVDTLDVPLGNVVGSRRVRRMAVARRGGEHLEVVLRSHTEHSIGGRGRNSARSCPGRASAA
jgi:hypothetical protein